MSELLNALLNEEIRKCEICGSNNWRVLHAGDESNCECEGECLRVCDESGEDGGGCDGVAELVKDATITDDLAAPVGNEDKK